MSLLDSSYLNLNINACALQLHALKGDKKGYYSIRVNDQYRLIFQFRDCNAYEGELIDYH